MEAHSIPSDLGDTPIYPSLQPVTCNKSVAPVSRPATDDEIFQSYLDDADGDVSVATHMYKAVCSRGWKGSSRCLPHRVVYTPSERQTNAYGLVLALLSPGSSACARMNTLIANPYA